MDEANVFVLEDGSRQVMTASQIHKNKSLIKIEQKAMQEKSDKAIPKK